MRDKARYASYTIVSDVRRRTAQAVDSSSYWYVRLNVADDASLATPVYSATSDAVSAE